MAGGGFRVVRACESLDVWDMEPDAGPLYCEAT